MKERLGTIIVNGELIDMDKVSIEKLKNIKTKLEERERCIRQEIEKILID